MKTMPFSVDLFSGLLHRLRDYPLYLPNPTFRNPEWEKAGFRVLVVRLSPFSDVARSSPHLFLAAEVRAAMPDAFVDMAFLPCPDDATTLRDAGLPLLLGTQSRRPLEEFDLALISLSWLLEQPNLPYLLARSGVPLWASERGEEWPPLILGGSSSTAAHALVSDTGDCIADALFFGEGEGSVGRIVRLCSDGRTSTKRERLARIAAEVTGLWPAGSPAFAVDRARATIDAIAAAGASSGPVMPGTEAGTARLAITRGCPCLCAFCYEGFDRKPYREVPFAALRDAARALKVATGAQTLEIESFNFNTHADIAPLLGELHRLFLRVNLMSQRVDILARTPGLLALEIAADKSSFTLGIEGISGRSRAFLHKSLSEEDIRRVIEDLHRARTREVKLFYLLTGREAPADLEEFARFVKWVREMRRRAASPPRILFSFGMLVRMPFTPLRHDPPALDEAAWRPLVGKAKSICETHGFEFRLAMAWPEYLATQVLALGGTSASTLAVALGREGAVTDRGLGRGARRAVEDWARSHPLAAPIALPFLESAEERAMFHRRYLQATAGQDEGYCRKGEEGTGACRYCPGCTRVPALKTRDDPRLSEATRDLEALMARKRRLPALFVKALLPKEAAGLGTRWAEAWLMRSLLARHPEQVDNVLAMREAVLDSTAALGCDVAWYGQVIVAVTAWDAAQLAFAIGNELLSGFDPDAARSLRLRLSLPQDAFPDPSASLAAFLRDHHAPVTVTRDGELRRLHAGEKSLKKRMLLSGTCARSLHDHVLDLEVGAKPFIGTWLSQSFSEGAARRATAEIYGVT